MKKAILLSALAIALSSCSPKLLYNWGGSSGDVSKYEKLAYKNYDKNTLQSLCELLVLYETIITKPGGMRKMPPPGICAEYGYLLMQPETADTFLKNATSFQMKVFKDKELNSYFFEHGKEMFELEIKNYPESAIFLAPLIKKLSKR